MWRGGCIIRSVFLGNIKSAYDKNPELTNLLLDDFFRDAIHNSQVNWNSQDGFDLYGIGRSYINVHLKAHYIFVYVI